MSEFDFSSFLASITPPVTTEEIDEQPPQPTGAVCAEVRKSYSGRRFTFQDGRLDCDLRQLFETAEDESLPQLIVRTVSVLNSDNAANSDLPYAKQIAVNKTFLCYALKSGDLRIISRISSGRALVKTHNDDITCVSFLNRDSNRLLVASLDQKISIVEVWEKDEDIEFRVLMCVGVDVAGSIRISWGPQNDQLFVFAVQTWVVFVHWTKVVEGHEGPLTEDSVQYQIKCGSEATSFTRFLKFDAEVSFLKCYGNALLVGTTDGMLQIWNFTNHALQALFSEADPEISDPIVKLQVSDGYPVRHVELLKHRLFLDEEPLEDGQASLSFSFLTVSYPTHVTNSIITVKSWSCENGSSSDTSVYQAYQTQVLNLAVGSVEDFTSLSVEYCKRENLLILAERHWTHVFAVRCVWQDSHLEFECITKFPLKQEIVSMELSEDFNTDPGLENGIDLFCVQPMIVQQYILDADLCLPEIIETEELSNAANTAENPQPIDQTEAVVNSNPVSGESATLMSLINAASNVSTPSMLQHPAPVELELPKPETMPIPVRESFDLELSIPQPPVPSPSPLDPTGIPTVLDGQELGLQSKFPVKAEGAVVTPQGSGVMPVPIGEMSPSLMSQFSGASSSAAVAAVGSGGAGANVQSPKSSVHSRTRSDKLEIPVSSDSVPEPPISLSQSITAAAMHLLKVSQSERLPDSVPVGKGESGDEDQPLAISERSEKESPHLQNLTMMDGNNCLPMNSDFSDLVDTLERSLSNVKRMIQVLEHKLGRAFHSVNKRLDVNFQETLSRLDSLQSSGIRGQEDFDIRMREHTTVAMQTMLDVVQSTIQTEIKNTLRAVVGSAVQRVFAEFPSRQLSGLLNRCVENAISSSLSSAVSQGLQSNFRESFSDSIVPAFESAVQNMFGQIQTAFSAGLNEHLAGQNPMLVSQMNTILQNGVSKLSDFGDSALTDISALKATVATLSQDVQSMKQDLQCMMASSSQQYAGSGVPTSTSRATPDVVISEIFTLLKNEDYENAFNKALSLSRIDVLNKIINVVDYESLFATEPCPLSQSVLLSLLNQIGCDLVTDSETKLEWIRGAVTHLDVTPSSPRVGTLTIGVLDYLISKTQGMMRMGQVSGSLAVSVKMTLNMLVGVRNTQFSP